MKKTKLIYGLAAGIICSILFLGPVLFAPDSYKDPDNFTSGEIFGYSIMVVSMLPIYFGTRAYRNKYDGDFGFGKALGTALLITIIATLVFYLGNVLVFNVLAPGFLTDFSVYYQESMLESAPTEEIRKARLAEMEAMKPFFSSGFYYGLLMAGSVFFIGVVISLISAMVLKKNQPG